MSAYLSAFSSAYERLVHIMRLVLFILQVCEQARLVKTVKVSGVSADHQGSDRRYNQRVTVGEIAIDWVTGWFSSF